MQTYDAVVLGAGPGGSAAAQQIAHHGGSACLIEHRRIGGTCVNVGCMPTKAMLAATEIYSRAGQGRDMGLNLSRQGVDGQAFMDRVHVLVEDLTGALQSGAPAMDGIDYRRGHGKILSPGVVEIQAADGSTQRVEGRNIILATGSQPILPSFLPAQNPNVWTSRDAIEADDLPSSVVVLGGGALGCEFATAYSELGLEVSILDQADSLLPRMDPQAGKIVQDALEDSGATVLTGAQVQSVEPFQNGLSVKMADRDEICAQVLLVATGREPVTDRCGLETLDPEFDGDILRIDSRCRTRVENLYAVGDVAHTSKHAHLAMHMGMIAGDDVCGTTPRSDVHLFPVVTYTHPQIACVGVCGEDADRREARTVTVQVKSSGTALVYGYEKVHLKVVAEKDTGLIRGALWAAPNAGELIHEVLLAMRTQTSLFDLYATVHGHPSLMEMLHTAAEQFVLNHSDLLAD